MRKVLLILGVICLASCSTIKSEITTYKVNKNVIKKNFPNSFAQPVNGYNNLFTVSNKEYVYQVRLKNSSIVALDTLKSFKTNKTTTVIATRN